MYLRCIPESLLKYVLLPCARILEYFNNRSLWCSASIWRFVCIEGWCTSSCWWVVRPWKSSSSWVAPHIASLLVVYLTWLWTNFEACWLRAQSIEPAFQRSHLKQTTFLIKLSAPPILAGTSGKSLSSLCLLWWWIHEFASRWEGTTPISRGFDLSMCMGQRKLECLGLLTLGRWVILGACAERHLHC